MCELELWMITSLKTFKIFSHTNRINHLSYGLEIFSRDYPFFKVDCFEGILNQIELMEWQIIIQAAVTCSNLKIFANIAKKPFANFSHAYQHNH